MQEQILLRPIKYVRHAVFNQAADVWQFCICLCLWRRKGMFDPLLKSCGTIIVNLINERRYNGYTCA
jgi:hypothetical protein